LGEVIDFVVPRNSERFALKPVHEDGVIRVLAKQLTAVRFDWLSWNAASHSLSISVRLPALPSISPVARHLDKSSDVST